jgi:hypothetical protein
MCTLRTLPLHPELCDGEEFAARASRLLCALRQSKAMTLPRQTNKPGTPN